MYIVYLNHLDTSAKQYIKHNKIPIIHDLCHFLRPHMCVVVMGKTRENLTKEN